MAHVRRRKTGLHQDEVGTLEAYRQTVHKLALVKDYGGACCGIIAQNARRNGRQRIAHITLADVYAGAGQHRSAADPDGVAKGTALLFATIAREIQRAHPLVRMHVRLNDLDSNVVARLDSRVVHYRSGHAPTENVDIVVSQGRAESQILAIAREARSRKGFTLLFVDPFGIPPDLAVLSTAATACGWNEMLVNLDVGGLFRLRAAAEATEHERLSKADERLLDGAFGGDTWRAPYGAAAAWTADELQALATAYAERFAGIYPVRAVYRLWSTGNRIRFMVHLAPHPKARDTFSRCYERSQNVGLFQGRRMNEADRAEYALQLFELARGSSMTVDEIHSAGILPLDRGHIKLILRTADDRGMGRFVDDVMQWYKERQTPEAFKAAQLDLDLGA